MVIRFEGRISRNVDEELLGLSGLDGPPAHTYQLKIAMNPNDMMYSPESNASGRDCL